MKKIIIFDLDGTLLDTLPDLHKAVNFALSKFNMPNRTIEQVRKDIGNGVEALIERSVLGGNSNENYEKTLEMFKKYYQQNYDKLTLPYDGMLDTLNALKDVGYTLAVATNKIQEVATILIERFYPGLFSYIQGDDHIVKKKPQTDMIDVILKHFNLTKEETLYIGDTNVDEETSINAGIDYYLVTYGYRTIEEIKNSCISTNLIKNPKDLLEKILSI